MLGKRLQAGAVEIRQKMGFEANVPITAILRPKVRWNQQFWLQLERNSIPQQVEAQLVPARADFGVENLFPKAEIPEDFQQNLGGKTNLFC